MIPRINSCRPLVSLVTLIAVGVCLFFIHAKQNQISLDEFNREKFKERNGQEILTQLPLPIAYSPEFSEKWQYRRVHLQGSFLPEHEVYLENRTSEDAPKPISKKTSGFHIMMPFLLDSGEIVWVNRGWIKRDLVDRQNIPVVKTNSGKQVLNGYISIARKDIFEMPDEKPHIINGHVVALNFYLHDDKKELPNRNVYPFLITQTGGSSDGLIRPEEGFYYTPDYSFDLKTWWFTLLITIGFWLVSGIIKLRETPRS